MTGYQKFLNMTLSRIPDSGLKNLERKPRDRRKVGPTEFGRLLLPQAKTVLKDFQGLRDRFENLLGRRHTLVRFAATPTAMRRLVTPALRLFRQRRPKLRVQVMQAMLPSILTRLSEGAFDFIVTDEPEEALADTFEVEPLLRDGCVLVCGASHPLAAAESTSSTAEPLTAEVLARERWIGLGPFMPLQVAVQQWFAGQGMELPQRQLETSSIDLTIAELKSGSCVAVLPRELIHDEIESGELVVLPIRLDEPVWNISVVSLADQPRSTAADTFVDCLRQAAGRAAST